MKISAGTISRTIILALALINQLLVIAGHSIIPIADETINELVSSIFTCVTAIAAWWKNNSFTQNALRADKVLADLKEMDKEEREWPQ